jgi:hypothetical protein
MTEPSVGKEPALEVIVASETPRMAFTCWMYDNRVTVEGLSTAMSLYDESRGGSVDETKLTKCLGRCDRYRHSVGKSYR